MLLLPSFAAQPGFSSISKPELRSMTRDENIVHETIVAVMKWRSLIEQKLHDHEEAVESFFHPKTLTASAEGEETGAAAADVPDAVEREIALWEAEEARLSLHTQMDTEAVGMLKAILAGSGVAEAAAQLRLLQAAVGSLAGKFRVVEDAVKYLRWLRPYAAVLSAAAQRQRPVQDVVDAIPYIFNTFRMVWTCSKSYGDATFLSRRRFRGLMQSVFELLTAALRTLLRQMPRDLGTDMAIWHRHPTPGQTSEAHRRQKEATLFVCEASTAAREGYFAVKLQLEEALVAHGWGFGEEAEVGFFGDLEHLYQRAVDMLACQDAAAARYLAIADLKKAKIAHRVNAALLTATWHDLVSDLNDLPFDFTHRRSADAWAAAFSGFRAKAEGLKALESTMLSKAHGPGGVDRSAAAAPPAERAAAAAAAEVPMYSAGAAPLKQASPSLAVVLSFNPPEMAIIGPVREQTVDALAAQLPAVFSTASGRALTSRAPPQRFVRTGCRPGGLAGLAGSERAEEYWHYRANAHFADELAQAFVASLLLDVLEKEGGWVLRDTNAAHVASGEGETKVHAKFFFTKKTAKKKASIVGPVREQTVDARAGPLGPREEYWHYREKNWHYREEYWHYREEYWHYREEYWHYREEYWHYREEYWHYREEYWHYREEYWHYREEYWHYREEYWHYREEYWHYREEYWHYREEYWHYREEYWHYREEYWHYREEYWHYREEYWHYRGAFVASLLLDVLEKEGGWVLRDTNAADVASGEGETKVHAKFFFTKKTAKKKVRATTQPST
ncbi:hypothetical protein DIPPA_29994 [Diplonema papillatum]|nr:hypothetical protein DIPPA_29994 [Diplonema papillatum]